MRSSRVFAICSVLGLSWATEGILYGSIGEDHMSLALNALLCLLTPIVLWQVSERGSRRRKVAGLLSAVILSLLAFKTFHGLGLS
jgi:hypothetical protein